MRTVIAAALTAATIALAAPAVASAQLEPEECATQGLAGTAYVPGINCRQVEVDGALRRYVVYVPTTRPVTGSRAPLVMMFHGSSGTGEQFLRISGWREQADANGLVAVFPTGLRYRMLDTGRRITKWNDLELATEVDLQERPPGYPADAPMPADDVGFVDAMMADVGTQLPIDRHRVYASGFSNGANFTARLAVERADRLAAVGFAAGGLPVDPIADPIPTPARPIPMFGIVGTLDDRILARAGLPELPLNPVTLLRTFPIDAFLRVHVDALGLDPRFYGTLASPNSTFFSWPGTDPTFRFGVLAGLDHHYPNAHNNDYGFEAAPEFWRFFVAHPLP
jgi:polyhydroxybutyrate depolymerase